MQQEAPHLGWSSHLMELISRFTNKTCHLLNPIDESDLHWDMARSILGNKSTPWPEDDANYTDLLLENEATDLKKAC